MRQRLHFHSDCRFFAGSERVMAILWDSFKVRENYDVSFSYRQYQRYTDEVAPFLNSDLDVYPVLSHHVRRTMVPRRKSAVAKHFWWFARAVRHGWELLLLYPGFIIDVARLRSVFKSMKPTVVHLNNGGYPGARSVRAGAVAARLAGGDRVVMLVNNTALPYSSLSRYLDYPLDFLVKKCTDTFVTASAEAREALISVLNLDSTKVVQIPNAVRKWQVEQDRDQMRAKYGADGNTVVLGLVGLLELRKGHSLLVDAISTLLINQPVSPENLQIWFVGEGPLEVELKSQIQEAGLKEYFNFLGYRHDYIEVMYSMDIVAAPSLFNEDSPLATLEAMSLGIPVVAFQLAGLSEQVNHGVTGYLVPIGDSTTLSQRLSDLVHDDSMRERFGSNALERYEELYSPRRLIQRYLGLYSSKSASQGVAGEMGSD